MLEGIQRRLGEALRRLRGRGRLTEANIRESMEEVRKVLLDADVNYTVADQFIQRVREKSVGQAVLRSLDPGEQIVRIVYDELVKLMGPVDHNFHFAKDRPSVLMLCGLQGSGKTTTAGKLALTLRKLGRTPLLVAADLQRPAAVDQLKLLGAQLDIPVYTETIKFIGVAEKLEALEPFVPESMAQRIIGQGDIMGLVRKVQDLQVEIGAEELKKQQDKLAKGDFTLDDFRKQFEQLAKMGMK